MTTKNFGKIGRRLDHPLPTSFCPIGLHCGRRPLFNVKHYFTHHCPSNTINSFQKSPLYNNMKIHSKQSHKMRIQTSGLFILPRNCQLYDQGVHKSEKNGKINSINGRGFFLLTTGLFLAVNG